jgi:WD40 repeat protein
MDYAARIWIVDRLRETFGQSKVYRGHAGVPIHSVELIQGGRMVCSLDRYGSIHVWDPVTHQAQSRPADFDATITDMDISPDESRCVIGAGHYPAGEQPGIIQLLDLSDPGGLSRKHSWRYQLNGGFQRGIQFSPDGSCVALGTGREFQVRSVDTGQVVAAYGPLDQRTRCVRYSPNGSRVACTTLGGSTYVFRTSDYRLLQRIQSDTNVTFCVDFSPDGKEMLTGGGDHVIKKWDARSFEPIHSFREPCLSWVTRVLYSSDGKRVISATINGTVQIWRPDTGICVFRSSDKYAFICLNLALTNAEDGGWLFASGVGDLRVWSVPGPDTDFREPTYEELEFIPLSANVSAEAIDRSILTSVSSTATRRLGCPDSDLLSQKGKNR